MRKPKTAPDGSAPSSAAPAPDSSSPKTSAPRFIPRGGKAGKRILIAVSDNRIDFESMGGEAAKELNELLHNPEVLEQFGIGPLAAHFDPKHCERYIESFGRLLQGTSKFLLKFPDPAAQKLLYTESEKKELGEPTARVLDEFAPRFLRENQAFVAFLGVFGAITLNKVQEASMLARQINLEKRGGVEVPKNANPRVRVIVPPVATPPPAPPPGPTIIARGPITGASLDDD